MQKYKNLLICLIIVLISFYTLWWSGIKLERSQLGFSLIYGGLMTIYQGALTLSLYFTKDIVQTKYDLEDMALNQKNIGAIILQSIWLIICCIIVISSNFVFYSISL
jgi:hypothetical protein